jgi:hypothetical protein
MSQQAPSVSLRRYVTDVPILLFSQIVFLCTLVNDVTASMILDCSSGMSVGSGVMNMIPFMQPHKN